ncbi:MAG: 2-aminobenzoate-CoA ligase [Herbaspirillum sp.]|jgi:2-aminobenzoate-CoA ligase|nr:2-aminobenzoate-CoA ligase [Herbaspirillum sp.]
MTVSAHTDTFARDNLPPPALLPEFVFDLPALRYPDRLNCVAQLLDRMVGNGCADRIAIYGRDTVWTYADLLEKVDRICGVLRDDLRLAPGNRVLLRGANNPMMAACFLAVLKMGCIAVPTMPLLRSNELCAIVDKARIGAALCSRDLSAEMELAAARCEDLTRVLYFNDSAPDALEQRMARHPARFDAVDTAADDICIIGFTSGTTGKPKGTMHVHRDVLAICDCFPRSTLASAADDIFVGTSPLAFTFGLGGMLLFPLRVGAATVLIEKMTPGLLLQTIQELRATVCFTVPTFYRQMAPLLPQYDVGSLRKSVSAGEALSAGTRALWRQASGLEMIDGIGTTEMLHIFISAAGEGVRAGATGKPIPGYRACILDQDGHPAAPGEIGRLAVKGPTGCRYLADPRQADYVCNGWNVTGDAYRMDSDGYFWYCARTDDMIVSAGYNIAGPEVEEALAQHPAVAECCVVGCDDAERGQIVKAYVVPADGAVPDEALVRQLQEFVKHSIAPYKYPRAIEFCASLPYTESGKLQRYKLRQRAAAEGAA